MTSSANHGLVWNEAERDLNDWQGLRALGFVDPPAAGLWAELDVTLYRASAGLSAADIEVRGPDGQVLPGIVQPVADGDTQIIIHFADPGPRGPSTVRLLTGGTDPLHPFFCESTFDFHIDCPADDCRAAPPLDGDLIMRAPSVDLATKDYRGFLQVAQDWILSTDPKWSDLSVASSEKMLVELMAHHAEMLSLHQDRVLQEAFTDTARERLSINRHAGFIGLDLDMGDSAVTTIAVDVTPGNSGYLPEGTQAVRRDENGAVTLYFQSTETRLLDGQWNAGLSDPADAGSLRIAAWPGAHDAIIPAGTTALLLLDWNHGLIPGQRIFFLQGTNVHIATLTDVSEIQEPGWSDSPADAPTTAQRQITRIAWDTPSPQSFQPWIDLIASPFLIGANLVDVIHGQSRRGSNAEESGTLALSDGRNDAVFSKDSVTGSYLLRALRTPEPDILIKPGLRRPDIDFEFGGHDWHWQSHLWNSAGFDHHFTTEYENDGSVWLIFGDGQHGAQIDAGNNPALPEHQSGSESTPMVMSYRRGDAELGNIGLFALNGILPKDNDPAAAMAIGSLGVRAVTNIVPGSGGRGAVSLETARQLIPESIRHPARERCVTAQDYADAAQDLEGIAHAAAKPLGGIFNTIAVLCAPDEGDILSDELANRVYQHLDLLRMAGREHIVREPDYVPLDIALLICPKSGTHAESIRKSVQKALAPGSSNTPGFFHRSRLGFGAEIRASEILAAVAEAPGVGAAKLLTFRPLLDAGTKPIYQVIRLSPTEIAQFKGELAHPEKGRLTVRVEGFDPPDPPDAFVVGGPAAEPVDAGGSL